MKLRTQVILPALGALVLTGTLRADELPRHQVPTSKDGNLVVGLCDGKTAVEVKGVKQGQPLTRAQAQAVSDQLMSRWKQEHPDARWDEEGLLAQAGTQPGGNAAGQSAHGANTPPKPAASPRGGTGGGAPVGAQGVNNQQAGVPAGQSLKVQAGQTYGAFGKRDEEIWRASTQQFVDEGNRIFHDSKRLGGTIAVSCDMCHPNAANTHPETYPKYQVQLGRVALLRDMINWCIENPVRGKPLKDDDPRLKALEAYIYAQRKGTPLDYGNH